MGAPRSRRHRSAKTLLLCLLLALALALALAACGHDPVVTTRTVTAYVPAACTVPPGAYATYTALGDYEPASRGTPPLRALDASGAALSRPLPLPEIDAQARALVVTAGGDAASWEGVASVPPSGDVNVLLLPSRAPCALTGRVGLRAGATLAPIGSGRVMLVGGAPMGSTPATYVADLGTGEVAPVSPGLPLPRTGASVTAFGDGGLVAGGAPYDGSGPTRDAEVYSPAAAAFTASIALTEPRAHHGAVVLADGRTLLVGGVGGAGGATLLASMEAVDPATRAATEGNVARLAAARRDPTALRLASGEVLVAGGVDLAGAPVATLEWFPADASPSQVAPRALPTTNPALFARLGGGGALALDTKTGATWIVGADHAIAAAAPYSGELASPVLFDGTGGAPLLWTGRLWVRWDPYAAAFARADVLPGAGGDANVSVGPAACSPDAGLALWLDESAQQLVALRFDTTNAYSPLPGPLLVADTADTAPDRAPGPGAIAFAPGGGMTLSDGASVFVADRTYADVAVDVTTAGAHGAYVVLRDGSGHEAVVAGTSGTSARATHVERRGATVTWSVGGGPATTSAESFAEGDRVSVGVRAPASGAAIVTSLAAKRLGAP